MHQSKINLQSAFNQSEIRKTSPYGIKIDKHRRQVAVVIVSAMKILGEQKHNRKTVYYGKEKIRISFTKKRS